MKYKKLFSRAFALFTAFYMLSFFTLSHAQVTTPDIPLLQSDIDATTMTVYPNPINGKLHYIQDVITGTGTYFSGQNSFLYCYDANDNFMVCYCIEPTRPAPTASTAYTDYIITDVTSEDGIRQAKTFPILTFGFSDNGSSCNSYLHDLTEKSQQGGTFGNYVVDGEVKMGLLINGVFFEMSAGEAYGLTAALVHKMNGADVGEITGSVAENYYEHGDSVKNAAAYLETIADWTYEQGVAGGSLWHAADALNQCQGPDCSIELKVYHPTQGWITMPDTDDITDWSIYSTEGKIYLKAMYQASYMECKLIESEKSGSTTHLSFDHDCMTTVSFNSDKNGYYDYFHIKETPSNSVNVDITYGALTNESFTPADISADYAGTKFCQEAEISFSLSDLEAGGILDLSIATETGACRTPAYGDGDGDGTYNLGVRYFQTSYYQNIAVSSPNSYINPLNYNISLSNEYGSITLKKFSDNASISSDNDNYSLKGAEYSIYTTNEDAATGKSPYQTAKTDEAGNIVFKNLPYQTYYIKETKAPNGYNLNENIYTATLNSSNISVNVECPEQPKSFPIDILLKKVDENGIPLANGEFIVKYYESVEATNPAETGKTPVKSWIVKTDENGVAKLSEEHLVSGDSFYYNSDNEICFPIGTVTIEEKTSPNGYFTDDIFTEKRYEKSSEIFICTFYSHNTARFYAPPVFINEEYKQAFQIIKTGKTASDEDISLEGAGFMACPTTELNTDASGNYIWDESKAIPLNENGDKEIFTDENGYVKSCPLSYGKYLIKETTIPFGYKAVDDFVIEINADSHDDIEPIYLIDELIEIPVTGQIFINKLGETRTWNSEDNTFYTEHVPLANIQFDIYACEDIYQNDTDTEPVYKKDEFVCSIYTNESGVASTIDLLAIGKYNIKENTPIGYKPVETLTVDLSEITEFSEIEEATHIRKVAQYTLDITNELIIPSISSYALDDNTQTQYCEITDTCSVTDTIIYDNLLQDEEYVLKGTLINKATGEILSTTNAGATSTISFIPESSSGEICVPFCFSLEKLENTDIVIFEELYHNDTLVATHTDIDCIEQTIYLRTTPEEPETPDEPDKPVVPEEPDEPTVPDEPKTGDNSQITYIIVLFILTGLALSVFAYKFFSSGKQKPPKQ